MQKRDFRRYAVLCTVDIPEPSRFQRDLRIGEVNLSFLGLWLTRLSSGA
jgi:hypothetical protein